MMTKWYVKDLSKITNISVQTLHYYDHIDLLKPSLRMSNGYRIYSEKDLLKLQQIIALKFFGFELSQIKTLIASDAEALKHFTVQAKFLEEKANILINSSKTLKNIVSDVKDNESIPWETIIKLIEVYNMTEQLEDSWVKEIFTPEELKQYADFKRELKSSNPEQKATFEKAWSNLVVEIENNLEKDPKSETGINLAKNCMLLINGLYGKKYAHLRTKKFEQGFGKGKGLQEIGFNKEIVSWLEVAMDTYYKQRIYAILADVGKVPSAESLKSWHEVSDEMYGDDSDRKQELVNVALQDEKVSLEEKKWLQRFI